MRICQNAPTRAEFIQKYAQKKTRKTLNKKLYFEVLVGK
jgi:hypothetical protein